MDNEVRCGSAEEIAKQLQDVASGASWEVWEDPKYEWLGDLYRFTPALGLWTAECGSEGDPLFTPDQALKLVDDTSLTRDEFETKLGPAHEAALRELAERSDGVVPTPHHNQEI